MVIQTTPSNYTSGVQVHPNRSSKHFVQDRTRYREGIVDKKYLAKSNKNVKASVSDLYRPDGNRYTSSRHYKEIKVVTDNIFDNIDREIRLNYGRLFNLITKLDKNGNAKDAGNYARDLQKASVIIKTLIDDQDNIMSDILHRANMPKPKIKTMMQLMYYVDNVKVTKPTNIPDEWYELSIKLRRLWAHLMITLEKQTGVNRSQFWPKVKETSDIGIHDMDLFPAANKFGSQGRKMPIGTHSNPLPESSQFNEAIGRGNFSKFSNDDEAAIGDLEQRLQNLEKKDQALDAKDSQHDQELKQHKHDIDRLSVSDYRVDSLASQIKYGSGNTLDSLSNKQADKDFLDYIGSPPKRFNKQDYMLVYDRAKDSPRAVGDSFSDINRRARNLLASHSPSGKSLSMDERWNNVKKVKNLLKIYLRNLDNFVKNNKIKWWEIKKWEKAYNDMVNQLAIDSSIPRRQFAPNFDTGVMTYSEDAPQVTRKLPVSTQQDINSLAENILGPQYAKYLK
jgi:hypothetical protein